MSCVEFESLLASEELSVTEATHVHNYLQMQVMVIIIYKLMNPVQDLISLCGTHISAGTLQRLICDQRHMEISSLCLVMLFSTANAKFLSFQ